MKQQLQRHAVQALKAKPVRTAHTVPTPAPAARSWSAPDPGAFAAQKPAEAPVTKRDTLDRKMVAELAKIAGTN